MKAEEKKTKEKNTRPEWKTVNEKVTSTTNNYLQEKQLQEAVLINTKERTT